MATTYTNYTNLDSCYNRGYKSGDRVVRGYSGEIDFRGVILDIEADALNAAEQMEALAEAVYARHNQDNRPDGQLCPSMSIGDVVVFGEVAMTVERRGFCQVVLLPADVITNRTWKDMV